MSNEAPTDALRLVPVRATPQMIAAMDKNIFGQKMDLGSDFLHGVWASALAAAPASPLPGGGECSGISGELNKDVVRLVIAARRVAYEGAAEDDLRALDIAAEAFASRVPWDDEPDELPAAPTGDA